MNYIDKNSLNISISTSIIILDVDGTLTPHRGGYDKECMFYKGWNLYSKDYQKMEEVKLIRKMLLLLRKNNFMIIYNSNGRKHDILRLFEYLGIQPNCGNSREDTYTKSQYLDTIQTEFKDNKIYYAEDDVDYLSKSKVYNISCNNGWWLGKQLKVIVENLKNEHILPEEVRDLYKLLYMQSDNILQEFE